MHPDRWVPEKLKDPHDPDKNVLSTPLKPFYKSKGSDDKDFWNSQDAKAWEKCGFAVPGTVRPETEKDWDDIKKITKQYICKNYFWISYPGSVPPPNLGFPKDMDTVEALIGTAVQPLAERIPIIATINKDGELGLVHKSLAVNLEVKPVTDKLIDSVNPQDSLNLNYLPPDVLKKNGYITWNARHS